MKIFEKFSKKKFFVLKINFLRSMRFLNACLVAATSAQSRVSSTHPIYTYQYLAETGFGVNGDAGNATALCSGGAFGKPGSSEQVDVILIVDNSQHSDLSTLHQTAES